MTATRLIACVFVCLFLTAVNAEDWPRFRGPNGEGVSASTLPVSWTPEANVAWKATLPGPGVSCPIVVEGRVFVTSYSGYGLERENPGDINNLVRHLVCFDAATGDKIWQKDIPAAQPEDPFTGPGVPAHGYASHTPVSDGEHVYVFFGKGGAFAFDLDGNQLWQRSLGMESDPEKWGSSSSPILYDDLVIVTAAAESQAIVGLDKATGKEVWRQEAAGLDNYWGTPILVPVDAGRTDLVMSVAKEMWGLDPSSGKLRWHCEATDSDHAQSSPVVAGTNVFAFTGRNGGSVAVKVGGKGDVTQSNVVWAGRDTGGFGSPIRDESNLYLINGNTLFVIDPQTGTKVNQVRLQGGSSGGRDYPSPVIANDRLYYLNGKGETFVFSLGSDPQQLSINLVTTDSDEIFGGTPAISDNRMFLRSNKHLYCVADAGGNLPANASDHLIAKADPEEQGGGRRGFDPTAFFNRLDQNKDGSLTADELQGPFADRFAELDKDESKTISMEEFRSGMQSFGRRGRGGGRGGFGSDREDNRPKRPQRPTPAA